MIMTKSITVAEGSAKSLPCCAFGRGGVLLFIAPGVARGLTVTIIPTCPVTNEIMLGISFALLRVSKLRGTVRQALQLNS